MKDNDEMNRIKERTKELSLMRRHRPWTATESREFDDLNWQWLELTTAAYHETVSKRRRKKSRRMWRDLIALLGRTRACDDDDILGAEFISGGER